jgi:hypothetical protein
MSTKSISSEDFAADILQVLYDQYLVSDSFLILADAIQLAVEQGGIEIPDQTKTAAVNYLYSGRFVDTWNDPENNRCVKINRVGITEVTTQAANRQARGEAKASGNRWVTPVVLLVIAIGALILWKFKVFEK